MSTYTLRFECSHTLSIASDCSPTEKIVSNFPSRCPVCDPETPIGQMWRGRLKVDATGHLTEKGVVIVGKGGGKSGSGSGKGKGKGSSEGGASGGAKRKSRLW